VTLKRLSSDSQIRGKFESETCLSLRKLHLPARLTLELGFCSLTLPSLACNSDSGVLSMSTKNSSAISRREFARRAVFVSAAASLSPADLLTAESAAEAVPPLQTPSTPKLSAQSQAEVESRIQAVFAQYGSHLSDAQKADLRRLTAESQAVLDRLRAYATENGDGPGLYLKPLIEREKKPSPKPTPSKPASKPKNS
jgi:hypothetical protein